MDEINKLQIVTSWGKALLIYIFQIGPFPKTGGGEREFLAAQQLCEKYDVDEATLIKFAYELNFLMWQAFMDDNYDMVNQLLDAESTAGFDMLNDLIQLSLSVEELRQYEKSTIKKYFNHVKTFYI